MKKLFSTALFLGALYLAFVWLTETELFSTDIRFNIHGARVRPRPEWDLLDTDVLGWHTPDAITDTFLKDLEELRELIEPEAAGLAAMRATNEDNGQRRQTQSWCGPVRCGSRGKV